MKSTLVGTLIILISQYCIDCQDFTEIYNSLCSCDVTVDSCDVNCCCDDYCSIEDRQVFATCTNNVPEYESRSCVSSSTIIFNSSDYTSRTESSNVLCIYYDNYRLRNYYTEPDAVETDEMFDEYLTTYGKADFTSSNITIEKLANLTNTYQAHQPLYIVADGILDYLILPQPVLSGYCSYSTPAGFLRPVDTKCLQSLTNLSNDCASAWHMDGNNYKNFYLLKTPAAIVRKLSNNVTSNEGPEFTEEDLSSVFSSWEELLQITGITTNTSLVEGVEALANVAPRNISKPYWDPVQNTCFDVALQVHYTVLVSGGTVLGMATEVQLGAVTTNALTNSSDSFLRSFSIDFRWRNDSLNRFKRSGNPGYIRGLPVMAGLLERRNTTETVLVTTNASSWLTMLSSNSDGSCDPSVRTPILFGENMQSGCLLTVSRRTEQVDCPRFQADILAMVVGPIRDRVAIFGNVSAEQTGDWIPILLENEPAGESVNLQNGGCSNVVLGVNYEILYAFIGSYSKPQAKIIGAKMTYQLGRDVQLQCIGPYCNPALNLTQNLPIVSSVNFVDVSINPQAVLAEVPTFNAKLPYDFFYPLSGKGSLSDASYVVLVCLFTFTMTLSL